MKKNAIILGAGPAGLITAWLLSNKGWSVKVFEKQNDVGGMCRSWKWKNNILDTGPHIFHTSDKKLWNFWKKSFGSELYEGEYWSKNVLGKNFDEFYHYPLSLESINNYPLQIKNKIIKELKNVSTKNIKSKNFFDHIKGQLGPTLADMYFKNYPEKVWGINVNDMTADWAPKRIKLTNKSNPFFINEFTAVGKHGTGEIYNIIKNNIIRNNGKIFLNSQINGFIQENNNINQIKFKDRKNLIINKNDIIISTLPLTLTSNLLGYKSKLKFRGIRSIYILLNKNRVLPKKVNWLYYSSKEILFNRISEPKTMSPYLCEKNKTYLCAEITYSKNDKIDKMTFQKIKEIIKKDLIKTKLVNSDEIIDFSENKEDFVYPVQFTDYKYELSKTRFFVSRFNQLYNLGTGGEFEYSDSQILFHKSMDLVDVIDSKNYMQDQSKKNIYNHKLNEEVKFGNNSSVYIIAEAGLNHNGSLELGKKLIDEARKTNCDAIKFQTFKADSRVSKVVKSVKYAEKADGLQENIHEMFERLALSYSDHKKLFNYAKKKIEIFCTPFDEEDVDFLETLKVNFYKIASVDLVNIPLIKKVGLTGKPLILSTGMSNLSLIEDAVNAFKETGNQNLILLHCLSSYPSNENEVNLNAIKTLKASFKVPVGLSDHFPGIEMSLISIGVGCNIIERHFTLNKSFEGPDHILSSEPKEMSMLVNYAHNSKNILGSGEKIVQPSEFFVINTQRKSIYAKKNIKKGEKLNKANLTIKGPSGGLLPKYMEMVINRPVKKLILKDTPITWDDI
jgi:sialic acid synthase SpsE/protoporphyrinogen oxidase